MRVDVEAIYREDQERQARKARHLQQVSIRQHTRKQDKRLERGPAKHAQRERGAMSPWLAEILRANGPGQPPKLYVWTPESLGDPALAHDTPLPGTDSETTSRGAAFLGADDDQTRPDISASTLHGSQAHADPSRRGVVSDRIHIIGVGNVGRLLATTLSSYADPPPITLVVHRPQLLAEWLRHPYIAFTGPNSCTPVNYSNFSIEMWSPTPPPSGPIREVGHGDTLGRVLVTTRAGEALLEIDRVRGYLDHRSTVLFAQNGMCSLWPPGGQEYAALRYPEPDLDLLRPNYGAVITTHGITSSGPFESTHASWAFTAAGVVLPNDAGPESTFDLELLNMFATRELAGELVPDWDLWTRQLDKLLINSIINPLTAILRCKNGVLFATRASGPVVDLMEALTFEAWRVFRRVAGARSLCQLRERYQGAVPWAERFEYTRLWEMLWDVGEKVKDNTSSMLQHVLAGKGTEVKEFNGWIVGMAATLGMQESDVACHRRLMQLVEEGRVVAEHELRTVFALDEVRSTQWSLLEERVSRCLVKAARNHI